MGLEWEDKLLLVNPLLGKYVGIALEWPIGMELVVVLQTHGPVLPPLVRLELAWLKVAVGAYHWKEGWQKKPIRLEA